MPSILQVALDTPLYRLFDYRLPDELGEVAPGRLVEVPFGRTRQIGVALGPAADSTIDSAKLRDVIRVLDDRPALPADLLRLAQFCADYYHYPLGAILLATLPPRLRNATPFVADTPWLVVTEAGQARGATRPRQGATRPARRLAHSRTVARGAARRKTRSAMPPHWWMPAGRPGRGCRPQRPALPRTAAPHAATAEQQGALERLLPALGRIWRAPDPWRHRQRQNRAVSAPD